MATNRFNIVSDKSEIQYLSDEIVLTIVVSGENTGSDESGNSGDNSRFFIDVEQIFIFVLAMTSRKLKK